MDVVSSAQSDASATNLKPKPAVPKKPLKLTSENDVNRTTHVRDMIRKLQEREQANGNVNKPKFVKIGGKAGKIPAVPDKEEMGPQASNQTLEDLKAIDEDIEKLRKQIEERDKIISALREVAEAKDKKLDNLMMECSKLRSNGKLDLDTSPESNRASSSSPSSPPLCNEELCWTDSFVNKNYHEPVYAQLLNDHTALQKVYNELRAKLESNGMEFGTLKTGSENPKTDVGNKLEGGENAINLIMAEQIRVLKEREAQLIWEAEELREQNDLMEFRILELEECRKEFLDKEMMNEGKHRTEKIVWRERDLEEISDSGVMSLPTSEDLTSDSELGEAIRNYSPLGAITNLSLSTPESPHSDSVGHNDLKGKKSLKSSECLQESGIFVDAESSDSAVSTTGSCHSKACQTESVLDKTLLDIIDSSCDLFLSKNPGYLDDSKSDDLSTEISKLSVIQKRIQQKTNSPASRSPHTVISCPHTSSVLFYEERLGQLEEKLKIYESSGDTKDILLAKRLQKEVDLAHRVKELTDKVTSLEAINKKLEEEKCEFEEAENDTRFQCQRLEIRLQELIDKNTELELELDRHKVIMNEERRREKMKENLDSLISKYEQRNFELEEKEAEARQRLSMIEAAMPAIVAYNVFKMVQNPDFIISETENDNFLKETKIKTDIFNEPRKPEKIFDEKKDFKETEREKEETEKEKILKSKIQELEDEAAKDREKIENMTKILKTYKEAEKTADNVDLYGELNQLFTNEIMLRAQIDRLEKKEQAYMQSLEKADEIWAGMEADYKKKLQEAEEANNSLKKRVSELEIIQTKLEKALAEQSHSSTESLKAKDEIHAKIEALVLENEKLKKEFAASLEKKFEEHRKFLEAENLSLKEELKKKESDFVMEERKFLVLRKELELAKEEMQKEKIAGEKLRKDLEEKSLSVISIENSLQRQILDLTQELNQKSKELSSLEVTVAELREEVETLENKVGELVETIQTTVKNQEEVSTMVKASKETMECSPPALERINYSVSVDLPKVEESRLEAEKMADISVDSKILVKTENPLPRLQVLIPCDYPRRFVVFVAPSFLRQLIQFLFPSTLAKKILLKNSVGFYQTIIPPDKSRKERERKEEEFFQLNLKNTELLQTLEKMEEESKLKDKELEELQKIALEIRQEQENLEALYGMMKKNRENSKDESEPEEEEADESTPEMCESKTELPLEPPGEEPKRNENMDFMQIINPIVVRTSHRVSSSLSCLQVALDNLQNKYRSKNFLSKLTLNEVQQKGDNREIDSFTRKPAPDFSSDVQTEGKNLNVIKKSNLISEKSHAELPAADELHQQKLSTSKPLEQNSSPVTPKLVSFSSPKPHSLKTTAVDPEFFYKTFVKTIRKVGDDGIFMEWNVARQPPNVTGFEIDVNGVLSHRVRSSTRNKAFLHSLNLKDEISIDLFAVSEKGRSMKSFHVTYPKGYFL